MDCINGFLALWLLVGVSQWGPLPWIRGKNWGKVSNPLALFIVGYLHYWPVIAHFRKCPQITHVDVLSVSWQALTDTLWEHIGRNPVGKSRKFHRVSGTWTGSLKWSRSFWGGDKGEVQGSCNTGQTNEGREGTKMKLRVDCEEPCVSYRDVSFRLTP